MPEPGSSAGFSSVGEEKAEVKRLVGRLDGVETELGNLKKDFGIANNKERVPKSIEALQKAFPNVLVEWENKSVDSLVKEIRSRLIAEIANKEDEKKSLNNQLTEKEKQVTEKERQVTEKERQVTEKEKQATAEKEAIARGEKMPIEAEATFLDELLQEVSCEDLSDRLEHPNKVANTFGIGWDYQGKEKIEKKIVKSATYNLNAFEAEKNRGEKRDKQNVMLAVVAGGAGTGKSKACIFAPRWLKNALKDKIKHIWTFGITFENGKGPGATPDLRPDENIAIRMLSHLCWPDTHLGRIPLESKRLSILGVIEAVERRLGVDPNTAGVLLMIDGVHNLSHNLEDKDDPARVLMREDLVGLMVSGPNFIFPMVTCLASITAMEALEGSITKRKFIRTPLLANPPTENGESVCGDVDSVLFEMLGGHGRAVENLFEVLEDAKKDSVCLKRTILLQRVKDKLVEAYGNLSCKDEHVNELMRAALHGHNFNEFKMDSNLSGGVHISTIIKNGMLAVNTDGTVNISVLWMAFNSDKGVLNGWEWTSEPEAKNWEDFLGWFRCLLSKLLPDNEKFPLRELLRGVKWSDGSIGETMVVNRHLQRHVATKRVETKGCMAGAGAKNKPKAKSQPTATDDEAENKPKPAAAEEEKEVGNWMVEVKGKDEGSTLNVNVDDRNVFILNASMAPAGDGFCRLEIAGDGALNEVMQAKYYSTQPIPKSKDQFHNFIKKEMDKSVSENDIFMFITTAEFPKDWVVMAKGLRFGAVHAGNLKDYLGPFSAIWKTSTGKRQLVSPEGDGEPKPKKKK